MMRSLLAALFAAAALVAAGCSSLKGEDETLGWSAQRLYGEAKDAMATRDWQKSIKLLEKLEARYPYGRYAQQAQLEIAYANWKDNERASAIAAADRFIKLYPNHPRVDYPWYLQAPAVEDAMAILVRAYDSLGMTDLRDAAGRVLVKNFPASDYLKSGAKKKRVPWWRLWDPDW